MKYAIIAAGEGSRLAAEGIRQPKPLVRIGGECLLDRLIRIFMDNDADEIVVICNDQSEQVSQHLTQLQRDGLQGRPVPLRVVVKSTPSSMHSLYEISPYLQGGPFILTTVDTIFREDEFRDYVAAFRSDNSLRLTAYSLLPSTILMGVTSYIDDEKPLYVDVDDDMNITAFRDELKTQNSELRTQYISAGIYGLTPEALQTLNACVERGESRMRNFQRALLTDDLPVKARPFSKVLDIDHASDIEKANNFLFTPPPSTLHPKTFKEKLRVSFKSADTEEWLDVHFTRPIGLVFALMWMKLGVHPNVVTILSIFLGMGAGYMFYFTDLTHNLWGVLLLMLANFCDSTDGQMARLTGKKTLIGRMLDGFSGDVWFFCIYLAILFRIAHMWEPALSFPLSLALSFTLVFTASIFFHSPQSSLADYYRQIHLYFLLGREGSELDNYQSQRNIYESLPKRQWLQRIFYYNYANYCRSQERRTPKFQQFFRQVRNQYPDASSMPQSLRNDFRRGSLPLMKYTNLLTFNSRAIIIYITCLLNVPYVYPILEMTVFALMYWHMHRSHEKLCEELMSKGI